MDFSKLNKKITIQKIINNSPIKNKTYEDYKDVWANIVNLHGKEFLQAQSVNSNISKKVIIRYKKELDPSIDKNVSQKYRVKYKNNFYDILYSDNIREENDFLEFMLKVI